MKTFKEYLIETLKGYVPYKWLYIREDMAKATFDINGLTYYVFISEDDPVDDPHIWDVVFQLADPPPGLGLYDITGTKNAFTVFATVMNIIQEFVSKRSDDIRAITFTAKEPSRQRLYDRLAKMLIQSLPNHWKLFIKQRGVRKYYIVHD